MDSHRIGVRTRAGIWAGVAGSLGFGMYYFDDWCESISSATLHGVFEAFELTVMGPGLALLAYLVVIELGRRDERLRVRISEERERRFAFLGRIAASVAHEIRNPLHNAHLLHEELAPRLEAADGDLADRLRQNLRRVDHATTLIYELARQPVNAATDQGADLDAELQQAIADVRTELGPGADIRLDGGRAGYVRCRAASTFIILRNLLRNACQASAPEPIRVTVSPPSDGFAEVSVRNRGQLGPCLLDESVGGDPGGDGLGIGLGLTRHLLSIAEGTLSFSADRGDVVARVRLPAANG